MAPTIDMGPSLLWSESYSVPVSICLDFLLPNGLFITLEMSREALLSDVRARVCDEAKKCQPAACIVRLKSPEHYLFVSVTQDAKTVEYYDYSKRLCDLQLFYTFFKLVEVQGDLQEKTYNSSLSIF